MFCIRSPEKDGVIIKNMLSGAVVFLDKGTLEEIERWISSPTDQLPSCAKELIGDNSILVPTGTDEVYSYSDLFFKTRDQLNDQLIIHLLPTVGCQLSCSYCFENGAERSVTMSKEILADSIAWTEKYLALHPELKSIKLVLFGGEPLTRKELIRKALPEFSSVAQRRGMSFKTELVSNGELLDDEISSFLFKYNWSRFQVTLDGPKDIHDSKRFGNNNRPTFDRIISNLKQALANDRINKIDVRINFDASTAEKIPALIDYLSTLGFTDRLLLSLGLLTETFNAESTQPGLQEYSSEIESASVLLKLWTYIKDKGFSIPEEYSSGPWCVATEKHTIVIEPSGGLQKCICTVGRPEYDFASVTESPTGYAQDERFERFKRTDQCKEEKCPFMPVCGGGCPWDSIVENGEKGFEMRFCEKSKLRAMNEGLLRLTYGSK